MDNTRRSSNPGGHHTIHAAHHNHIPAATPVTRHSTKALEFFGLASSDNPTESNLVEIVNEPDLATEPRSSYNTTRTISSKLKEQYPTLKLHARRTKRSSSILIQSCTPVWFTPPASLATIALALRLLPLSGITFSALLPLSTAFYLAAVALFVPVSTLFTLRLLLYPRVTYRATVHERDTSGLELGYLAAWPSSWILLVSFAGFAVAEGKVGNGAAARGLALAVYVCWWIGAVGTIAVMMFVLACLLSTRSRSSCRTGGSRFAPLAGFLVCLHGLGTVAFVGGLLAWLKRAGSDGAGSGDGGEWLLSAGMAGPTVVFSLCVTGVAWFLSDLNVGVLLHELVLIMGWPPPEHTATTFSMVGPLAQCGAAFLILADATERRDGREEATVVTGLGSMPPLEVICLLLALLLGGMAVLWLLLALIVVFYRIFRRELEWNPNWYAAVVPLATLAILSIQLSEKLGSAFFRIAACVLIILSVLVFTVSLGFSIYQAVMTRRSIKRDERKLPRETIDGSA